MLTKTWFIVLSLLLTVNTVWWRTPGTTLESPCSALCTFVSGARTQSYGSTGQLAELLEELENSHLTLPAQLAPGRLLKLLNFGELCERPVFWLSLLCSHNCLLGCPFYFLFYFMSLLLSNSIALYSWTTAQASQNGHPFLSFMNYQNHTLLQKTLGTLKACFSSLCHWQLLEDGIGFLDIFLLSSKSNNVLFSKLVAVLLFIDLTRDGVDYLFSRCICSSIQYARDGR